MITKKFLLTSLIAIVTLTTITGCSDRDSKYIGVYKCSGGTSYHLNESGKWASTIENSQGTAVQERGEWFSDENYISLKNREVVKDNDLSDMVYWDKHISNASEDAWWIFGKDCTKIK